MGSKERFYADIMALQPEVTGSCNLVIVKYPNGESAKFVVDCGLFQERDYQEYNRSFPFDSDNIDFVLVTHNHVDHVGRLPLLDKTGYGGKIYATKQTEIFLPLALYDSYKVLKDTAKRNHVQPLYNEENVALTLKKVVGCDYEQPVYVSKNIKATFFRNGHLIGAAMILVQISYSGYEDINILFTGDYNNKNVFFDIPDLPDWVLDLPLTIVQESTYGYMDSTEIVPVLQDNIMSCMKSGKTAICMVFSLGRCQEILYMLKCMQRSGKIGTDIPIYLDGKLAIRYTELYKKADLDIKEDMLDFLPENLTYVDKESRPSLLEDNGCKIIVTTSGMGTYGPAQVYIPSYIGREGCLIQFTGYTAEGTLGRELKDTPNGEVVTAGGLVKRKYADEINPKDVAILGRDYLFRICPYGLVRSFSTSYR